ncbi:MAG: aminotransferase class IV family protein, partial [Candidatus Zixiibacteriota bacterium]
MKVNCSINGKVVPRGAAKISIFDNSLFYADGLFETMLALGDRVVFLEDHLDRLEKGADLINLRLPASRSRIAAWIRKTTSLNRARVKKIRLTVTAGDSAFWAGRKTAPRVTVIVTDHHLPSKPFRLMVAPFRVDQDSPFRNVKTLSFVIEMTSRKEAYMLRFDDAIMLNRAGYVAETTSANVFWVKDHRLFTSPLTSGCLEGITRKHILGVAAAEGIPAFERNIRLSNLLRADEIFITSSIKLIIPVKSIKADRAINFTTGP